MCLPHPALALVLLSEGYAAKGDGVHALRLGLILEGNLLGNKGESNSGWIRDESVRVSLING